MKYTAKLEGQYLKLQLDRQVSAETIYRSWTKPTSSIGQRGTPAEKELCDAIAYTPGVLRSNGASCMDSVEHILLEGDKVSVKIIVIGERKVAEIANQIVKKIQRRIAKGETRRRVTTKELDTISAVFNKK